MYWKKKHVLICNASHCTQKGSGDVAGRFRLEVMRKKLDADIMINNCGTIDLCDIGPNVVVYPDNVIYSGVSGNDVSEIMEHLKGGSVVDRLVLGPNTEEEVARKAFYQEAVEKGGRLEPAVATSLAEAREFDEGWINEQVRRGFMARKPDPETEEERIWVTKKARQRYQV